MAHDATAAAPAPTRHDTDSPQVPPASTLGTGDRIGRYEIERPVGVGGMGVVYAAHDPQLDRRVAIKVLHAARAEAPDLVGRLQREAVALAKLTHPNVVAVHDAGVFDGRVFVAMQFVEGRTLGAELARRPRDWRGIVALFVAAGRGLAAAHAAGLVHRDIKPGNLLVDDQGQVRVTDFGLARAADDHAPDPQLPHDPDAVATQPVPTSTTHRNLLSEPMTQHGFVLGTPAYMAPEQMLGKRVTPRSDQFSFAVTLWEALYGQHPFLIARADEPVAEARARLTDAVLRGKIVPPPPEQKVPRWLRRAVERGLAREPEARWPSMEAMIGAIAPAPRRNRALVAGALVAAAAAGAALAIGLSGDASPPSCAALADQRIAPVWSSARHAALRERFAASGRPYAGAMADQAIAGLDAYAAGWAALRADGCRAARDRREESQLLAERRARCLDERLTALGAIAGLLAAEEDPRFVDEAPALVRGLPPVADCEDAEGVLAIAPPPPGQAEVVDALLARLGEARGRAEAGQLREAGEALDALAAEAAPVGYPPLTVGILRARGELGLSRLDPAAIDPFTEALDLATRHRLDREAARILVGMIQAAGGAGRAAELPLLVRLGAATAARIDDPAIALDVQISHGRALVRLRRYRDAAPVCREALAGAEALHGEDDLRTVSALDCLAEALTPLDQASEGLPLAERALAIYERELGPEHPAVADYLAAIAHLQSIRGERTDQRAALERALAIRTKVFGERHARVAEALSELAELEMSENDLAGARARTAEALAITEETVGADSRQAGFLHHQLGMIAAYDGRRDEAGRHLERAAAILEAVAGPRSQEVAMVLIFHGQVKGHDDPAAAAVMLDRAVSILEEWKDPRLSIAIASLAGAYKAAGEWERAAATYDRALALLDPANTAPHNRAVLRANAALAYRGAGRSAAQVEQLVEAARADVAAAGASADDLTPTLDDLAAHPIEKPSNR